MLNKEKDKHAATKETDQRLKEAPKAKEHGQCSSDTKSQSRPTSEKHKGQSCSMDEEDESECEDS